MNQQSAAPNAILSTVWKKGFLAVLLIAAFAKTGLAQFEVKSATNPPYNPERLIEDVFLGDGVDVVSVQYGGSVEAIGYFKEDSGPIGFSEGILLTTGFAASNSTAVGADRSASFAAQRVHDNTTFVRDDNLEMIVPFLQPNGDTNIYDIAKFTITFVPRGDKVKFRYVFASEEYPEFVCSDYNDIFGFFIDGPGFSGPFERGGENLALIPGTNLPVTINSINPGTHGASGSPTGCGPPDGSLLHSSFYVDNAGGASPTYDGMTTILTAEADVTPCQTYTIQITLGDVKDGNFDSGVFLEAKSFSTPVLLVDVETVSLSGDVAEGCMPAQLTFEASEIATVPRVIPYTVGGTATPGVDYDPLPGTITIPPGVKEVSVPINAYQDNITETPESITIEVQTDACSTKLVSLDIVDNVIPQVPVLLDTIGCNGDNIQLDGTIPRAVDSEITFTNAVPALIAQIDDPIYRDITVSGIQPTELRYGLIARVCLDITHNNMEDLDIFLYGPNGKYVELSTDNGGAAAGAFRNACFTPYATRSIEDPTIGPLFDAEYAPEGEFEALWSDNNSNPVNGDWRLQIIDDQNSNTGFFRNWSITFEPVYGIDYVWTPATGLSCADCPDPIATVNGSATYNLTATDTYGCEESATVTIDEYPATTAPTLSCISGFDNIVFNWNTDPLVVTYEVNIDNAGWVDIGLVQTDTIRGLGINQTVNYQIRAVGNCDAAEISTDCTTQNCAPYTLSAVPTSVICAQTSEGEVTLTPSGGVAPFTFTVDTISNSTGVISGLPAGNYTASVSDANGCGSSTTFTIVERTAIATSVSITPPTSCGDPFVATATGSAGSGGPFTYSWTGGLTGAVQSFSVSGTYYVTVMDNAMCTALDSAVIVVPEALSASYNFTQVQCAGADDGFIQVSATGGTGAVEYGLNGSYGSSGSFGALAPGAYTVSARDALGCLVDTTITIVDPAPLTLVMGKKNVGCNGGIDGMAWVDVAGARGPVTYSWTGFSETSDTLRNLPQGRFYVTVTDSVGCSAQDSVDLFESGPLSATLSADSVACFGESNGILRANTAGGRAPFSFLWSTGVTTVDSVLTGLPMGAYSVMVTDSSGCSFSVSATIGQPAVLRVSHSAQPVTCAGTSSGEIVLAVTGGTPPYSYAWADGASTRIRSNLAAGTYGVTVTDDRNCTATYSVTLEDPNPLQLDITTTDVSCFGYADGTISTTPSGGLSPYFYTWSGPNGYSFFGRNPVQLIAGDYQLNFRDTYGCTIDTTITIQEPGAVVLTTAPADSICFGASNGNTYVTVQFGTAPYSFQWDNGEVSDTAYALSAGQHVVEVTDANSCVYTDTTVINSLPEISLELDQTGILCYGDSNGVANVTRVNYGTAPRSLSSMTYSWAHDAQETGTSVSGLGGRQEVFVTATDARGCFATESIIINEPTPVQASAVVINDVSCRDGEDGGAEVSMEGGTPGYSFEWLITIDSSTSTTVNELPAGLHEVVGMDANGCTDTTSVTIREPDSLLSELELTDVNCFALNTGRARIDVRGGVVPYTYAWPNGAVGNEVDSLLEGDYVVVVTDANGCELRDTAMIGSESSVELTGRGFGVSCNGDRDGAIELTASGGNGPYEYQITGVERNIFSEFRYLAPNRYAALAVDRDGCPSDTLWVSVEEPQPLLVEAGENIEIELGESAQLFAQVFNGQGDIEYVWLPGDSSLFSCQFCPDPIIQPTFQGVIQVLVVDSNGCEAEDFVRIKLRKELQALVPTGFTPNSDGRDDRLVIHGKTGTEVISFRVFDRWGAVVFADGGYLVNNENRGWNGRIGNEQATGGVYIWEAQVRYLDGAVESLSGQTTLIR